MMFRGWRAARSAEKALRADGTIDLAVLRPGEIRNLIAAAGSKAIAVHRLAYEFPVSNISSYEAYLKVATGKVWASWKACDITAQVAGTVPFKVTKAGGTEGVEVQGLTQLLTYPNETMTFGELVYLTVMHVKATGNAYWLKVQPTLTGDRPLALIPLNPRRVSLIVGRNTGELEGYRVNGIAGQIPADEIIHFKRPHPNNDWYGLGDIEAGAPLFDDTINRSNWKEAFWKNGATPSGVLVNDEPVPPDPASWEKMKAEFAAKYQGAKNTGKVAWLSGKWTALKFGMTFAEMADIESRRLNLEEIFNLHGVPLSVAGVRDAANYATAEIDDVRFRRYTVLPMIRLIEDTVNTDLVAGFSPSLRLKFEVTGLINVGAAVASLTPAFDRGVISVNEFRVALGLDPDPENPLWDQHFISAGLMPLELAGIADQQATQDAAKGIVARFIAGVGQVPEHASNGNGISRRS